MMKLVSSYREQQGLGNVWFGLIFKNVELDHLDAR